VLAVCSLMIAASTGFIHAAGASRPITSRPVKRSVESTHFSFATTHFLNHALGLIFAQWALRFIQRSMSSPTPRKSSDFIWKRRWSLSGRYDSDI
jgi:hypothetical protein